jgi:UDP-N-acetylmuramate--alanine ligase
MVGIGGIGMSALAQLLNHQRKAVSGSDREASPTTILLEAQGITVFVGQTDVRVPAECELLIFSDAVHSTNPEREKAREMGIPELSYFEALGEVTKDTKTIAIAGTHGKTTVTGMLAKILQHAEKEPTAIVGSIVRDFSPPTGGSNFLAGRDDLFVVEACEYRDHLLKLSPSILVITNIELDHTDYFPNLESLQETFRKAAERVPESGIIVTNPSEPVIASALERAKAPIIDYTTQSVPRLELIGEFNRQNAQAAKAAARAAYPHLDESFIDKALLAFKGSWRRFEYKGETPSGALVYDDYAHHPTAVRKTIEGAREKFPDKKIIVAFHPHLYSRTKSFLKEFAEALAIAECSLIAPIYAAREMADPSVSNEILAAEIRRIGGKSQALHSFDDIRQALLEEQEDSLIIAMGAGDIYKVAEQIAD